MVRVSGFNFKNLILNVLKVISYGTTKDLRYVISLRYRVIKLSILYEIAYLLNPVLLLDILYIVLVSGFQDIQTAISSI